MHALFKTLWSATHAFLFQKVEPTKKGPHIRDSLDLKRVMMLVVIALIPCTLMAIWNTGLQSYVYSYGKSELLLSYIHASSSFGLYLKFCKDHFFAILFLGLKIFLPNLILIYLVGGFWEAVFASIKGKEISEGFLVTGILFALILPSTLPYWMIVVGVSLGIVIGKELFGGTGMNILNPALVCRCILYFTFPAYMTGQVWVGESSETVRISLAQINKTLSLSEIDGYTAESMLQVASTGETIKRIHVDAIALAFTKTIEHRETIEKYLTAYNPKLSLSNLTDIEIYNFVTSPSGLYLPSEFYTKALAFAKLKYGYGNWTNWNFFLGNMIGSMGETSKFACLLGALFLLLTGIASWHTMLFVLLGAFVTALTFQFGSHIGPEYGLWNPANYDLPAYKQLLLGGLAFGLVFMATDPVSSPTRISARCAYGFLIGFLTIIIRLVNPAFPEGVMLAILFGNVFAPLFDRIAIRQLRKPFQKVKQDHA